MPMPALVPLSVHHFGPDPAEVGGMESVLATYRDQRVGGDMVEVHPTWSATSQLRTLTLFGRAMQRLRQLEAHDVVHVHLSEGGSFVREGALVRAAAYRGLRVVATLHGADFEAFSARHGQLVRAVLSKCGAVVALSDEAAGVVSELVPGAQVELIPNPIVMADDAGPADNTEELALFAGEMSARKGADVLAAAWPAVRRERPNARCIMVGPRTSMPVAAGEGLAVWDAVPRTTILGLIDSCRLVVLPSRAEAMPMILLEALSRRRPFISTPVGGIPALAGAGGMLVPVGDAEALAAALITLLADPARAGLLGEQGHKRTALTRSSDVVDGLLREVYAYCRRS